MKTRFFNLFSILIVATLFSCNKQAEILYVGTYAQRESQGIYVFEYERNNNNFSLLQTLPRIENPNFLAIHPDGELLYAVNTIQTDEDSKQDMVTSFTIDSKTGKLTKLNQMPTFGAGACHISIDKSGRYLFVSHYRSGSLTTFNVTENGAIADTIETISYSGGSVTPRQKAPHVHSCLVSPDNRFVYVADLGTDKMMIYELNHETGLLTPAEEPFATLNPGAGPRHFTFHPNKPIVYVAEELSSAVTVFNRNESTGALTSAQTLTTLPESFTDQNTVADIHVGKNAKTLYVTNRGHNSVAIFSIQENGHLSSEGFESVKGDHPRNFMVDPKGNFLLVANMNSDNVVQFKINEETGTPAFLSEPLQIPAPVCLKWHFLP